VGDPVEVGQRVVVAEQAEVDRAVVGHDRDPEGGVAGQRDLREDPLEPPAEQVEGELRARHVGDREVEHPLMGLQAGGLGHDRRRREAGQAVSTSPPMA
jgi:hypothetical protein